MKNHYLSIEEAVLAAMKSYTGETKIRGDMPITDRNEVVSKVFRLTGISSFKCSSQPSTTVDDLIRELRAGVSADTSLAS